MVEQVKVIIGAGYGDEGKGVMTDYFAYNYPQPIVVRFNGGAQAGHTVVTPKGIRHVFHHFGAGTLAGAPTYLSQFFIVNPILFMREHKLLETNPVVYIHEDCLLTTPYDMMLNEMAEEAHGEQKHGSCGCGINETIVRNNEPEFGLTVGDLIDVDLIKELNSIREIYVYERANRLGFKKIPSKFLVLFEDQGIMLRYLKDIQCMLNCMHEDGGITTTEYMKTRVKGFQTVLFEGAQGLMLDKSHKNFPFVTPSNTGIKNVCNLYDALDLKNSVNITYVTRTYLTRHGAGPLPSEVLDKPYPNIIDETNIKNMFQGALRFGLLDVDVLHDTIHNDLTHIAHIPHTVNMAVTCLDQVEDLLRIVGNGKEFKITIDEFIDKILDFDEIQDCYLVSGPSRTNVFTPVEIGFDS